MSSGDNNNNDEDVKKVLHIASVNTSTFRIPRGRFISKLEDAFDNVNSEIRTYKRNVFEPKKAILKNIDLQFSPLSVGLYNAVVDTGHSISITDIFDKVKDENIGLASDNDFKITEFTIRYGKFKTAVKFTKEYGVTILCSVDF